MGRSAESFKRNFSDSEARVEAYLPVGRGLPGLGVWRLGGGVSGFLILKQKLPGPLLLPSNSFNR